MCVICYAAKKQYIKRDEVLEAMRSNPSGFFMAALHPDKTRETIRTLDKDEAIKFFDDKVGEDDAFVLHARIPSYGSKTLDNVHGWEEDGIIFTHNMSLHNIDGFRDKFPEWKDKTDSEFFFKKMFIPFYRGYGAEAYKDGKLHDDIRKFVDWVCGCGNRFLFIMPDNEVYTFGDWVYEKDRMDGDKPLFTASNSTYKTYKPVYTGFAGGTAPSASPFRSYEYDDYRDDYEAYDSWANPETKGFDRQKETSFVNVSEKTIRDEIGDKTIAEIAVKDLVLNNLILFREGLDNEFEPEVATELKGMLPSILNDDTYNAVIDLFELMAEDPSDKNIEIMLSAYSKALARSVRVVNVNKLRTELAFALSGFGVVERMMNTSFDWKRDATRLVTAFYLKTAKKGAPKMELVPPAKLICYPDELSVSRQLRPAFDQVNAILGFIRKCGEK